MSEIKLFLGGDVMTGRGIDQILAHPCDPTIHERFMASALGYVDLAEQENGPIAVGAHEQFRGDPHFSKIASHCRLAKRMTARANRGATETRCRRASADPGTLSLVTICRSGPAQMRSSAPGAMTA